MLEFTDDYIPIPTPLFLCRTSSYGLHVHSVFWHWSLLANTSWL